MTEAVALVANQVRQWGIVLDEEQVRHLKRYADILAGYQEANVVGTKNYDSLMVDHILDSISCLLVNEFRQARRIVDIGTGGGLPGIPLGIVNSHVEITLLDATMKKTQFLHKAIKYIGADNFKVLNARAEEIARSPNHREVYDLTTSRAVATLSTLLEYSAPFVRVGGLIVAMKGKLAEEEMSTGAIAAVEMGLRLKEVVEVEFIPGVTSKERRLVVFEKHRPTPAKYPRRVGLAKQRPLGKGAA